MAPHPSTCQMPYYMMYGKEAVLPFERELGVDNPPESLIERRKRMITARKYVF